MTDDLEKRMRAAFDAEHMPQGLAERTLARIEAERAKRDDAAQAGAAEQAPGTGPVADPDETGRAPRLSVIDGSASSPSDTSRRRPAKRRRLSRPIIALAACLIIAALGIGGVAWAWQPYAYVAIDVNPSLELGVNRFNRIASAQAFNADGEQVLEAADVDGMTYEEALDAVGAAIQGYLSSGATVEVTVVCDDRAQATALEDASRRCLDSEGAGEVHCSHASSDERDEAAAAGMGLGKYRVYAALVDAGVEISADQASEMTMRELLDLARSSDVSLASDDAHDEEEHISEDHAGADTASNAAGNKEEHGEEGSRHQNRRREHEGGHE